MSLSFFITSKIHTYYVKKQESIRVVIPVYEPPYRPFDEERAIPYLAAYKATLNSFKRYRSKTRQRLTIRWEKEMQELLEKYQAQTVTSPYLFPFLVDEGNKRMGKTIDKLRDEKRPYHNAEACISYHLRKLGVKIGIKGKLTLYVARHSWATAARDNQIPISVISEALGHHSEITTQIYLRFIKSSEVDDANAKILAVL